MIERLERLINLVIALRETRRPLPADEIRRRVAGYGQDEYESFRRMFERDKSDLRMLGVPIETAPSATGDDIDGYRIDPQDYDLPPVEFAADELAALGLALQATGLMDEAGTGLRKLAVGQGGAVPRTPDPVIAVAFDGPNRSVLTEAQLTRTRVRFTYRRSDGREDIRVLEPHGMVFRRGRWYVLGRDTDRGAARSFRLDRIVGPVRTTGKAGMFPAPEGPLDVDAVLPPAAEERTVAVIAATQEVAWRLARRARGEGRVLDDGRIAYEVIAAPDDIVAQALEEGPDLEILDPPELRARLRTRLDAVLEQGT